ncbi:hypothetical protein HOLleu_04210 [Holothuria leucospilota]|uniref:Sulfotransferase domain-containing protein n=1 Tax=Holothuria leucospilota TaxID=206669 RepID=A0A9Q1CRQ8_HOLLE|nr:hypothetical protein HOLleu_04210 [Holothuria leucospilota]
MNASDGSGCWALIEGSLIYLPNFNGIALFRRQLRIRSPGISQSTEYHNPQFRVMIKEKEISGFKDSPRTRWNECHIIPLKVNSCNNLPNYFLEEESRKEYKNAIINFWHIQKTGGSTLRQCLFGMYEKLRIPKPFGGMVMCGNILKLLKKGKFLKGKTYSPVVLGHYSLGMCDLIREEILDRKCSAFTIFRDPYDRVVSHYFYNRARAPVNRKLKSALKLPITDWLKKFGTVTWRSFFKNWKIERNEHGMKCSSIPNNQSTRGFSWPEDDFFINDIVNNLEKHLSFVGLLEDLPTTYKMLQEIYNLPFYDMCLDMYKNDGLYDGVTASAKKELKRESKRLLMEDKEIQKLMKFDMLLYEKGKEIFAAQKKEFEAMQRRKLEGKRRGRQVKRDMRGTGVGLFAGLRYILKPSWISYKTEYHPTPPKIMIKEKGSSAFKVPLKTKWNECHTVPPKLNSCNTLPNYFLVKDSRKDYQNAIINFWHVQKTGGTSIRQCMDDMYKQLNVPQPFDSKLKCKYITDLLNNETFLKEKSYRPVVRGHYTLGMCDLIREEIVDRKCSAFTILRDPYDRVVSHYYFNRDAAQNKTELRNALDLPITEWLKEVGTVTWRSFFRGWKVQRNKSESICSEIPPFYNQSRDMPGKLWPSGQDETWINDIVNNLEKHVSFVGLLEDLPTTYKMLQEVYDLPFYDMCMKIRSNVGSYDKGNLRAKEAMKRESKRLLMEDKEIQKLMKFDVLLYEKGKKIFEAQKKEFEAMQRQKL